ncbi:MAG: hypothetical protein ABGZ35_02705 [Planctomycetaceae bacterium]|jgi:DNA-binding response OmpR family regulator
MKHTHILVVDSHDETRALTEYTLRDAEVEYSLLDTLAGVEASLTDRPDSTLLILRAFRGTVNGIDVCQLLREHSSAHSLRILAIIDKPYMERIPEILEAGATDFIVAPFEPRELRMKADIVPPDRIRRIDAARSTPVKFQVHLPRFSPQTCRYVYDVDQLTYQQWQRDPNARAIKLDTLLVCPECECLPTFRQSCPECGCAFLDQINRLHHFSCGHIADEHDFEDANGLRCPKCRCSDLLPGADVEQMPDDLRCHHCSAAFSAPSFVGHCLSCDHRFSASAARKTDLIAWHVPMAADSNRSGTPLGNMERIFERGVRGRSPGVQHSLLRQTDSER